MNSKLLTILFLLGFLGQNDLINGIQIKESQTSFKEGEEKKEIEVGTKQDDKEPKKDDKESKKDDKEPKKGGEEHKKGEKEPK